MHKTALAARVLPLILPRQLTAHPRALSAVESNHPLEKSGYRPEKYKRCVILNQHHPLSKCMQTENRCWKTVQLPRDRHTHRHTEAQTHYAADWQTDRHQSINQSQEIVPAYCDNDEKHMQLLFWSEVKRQILCQHEQPPSLGCASCGLSFNLTSITEQPVKERNRKKNLQIGSDRRLSIDAHGIWMCALARIIMTSLDISDVIPQPPPSTALSCHVSG